MCAVVQRMTTDATAANVERLVTGLIASGACISANCAADIFMKSSTGRATPNLQHKKADVSLTDIELLGDGLLDLEGFLRFLIFENTGSLLAPAQVCQLILLCLCLQQWLGFDGNGCSLSC